MSRKILLRIIALLGATVLGLSQLAQAAEATPTPTAPHSGIAPYADKLLSEACQSLSSEDAFSLHAEITFDQVLPSNVKVQFAAAMDLYMQRPDELAVNYQSDLGAKQFWYSGDTLTIFDPPHMAYATASVPPSIDGMIQTAADSYHLTIPLADLVRSDPCLPLRTEIKYGGYVGVGDVNGVECDHLAFSSEKSDLQLWLDRSGKPIPRKFVINYRSDSGSPEFTAVLSDWKFSKEIAASHFHPEIPKDAKRIDFLTIKESKP